MLTKRCTKSHAKIRSFLGGVEFEVETGVTDNLVELRMIADAGLYGDKEIVAYLSDKERLKLIRILELMGEKDLH